MRPGAQVVLNGTIYVEREYHTPRGSTLTSPVWDKPLDVECLAVEVVDVVHTERGTCFHFYEPIYGTYVASVPEDLIAIHPVRERDDDLIDYIEEVNLLTEGDEQL